MRASANTSETCNNDGVSNKTTAFVRKTCFVRHESSNRTHGFRAAGSRVLTANVGAATDVDSSRFVCTDAIVVLLLTAVSVRSVGVHC